MIAAPVVLRILLIAGSSFDQASSVMSLVPSLTSLCLSH